jgi:hypothetical protein
MYAGIIINPSGYRCSRHSFLAAESFMMVTARAIEAAKT